MALINKAEIPCLDNIQEILFKNLLETISMFLLLANIRLFLRQIKLPRLDCWTLGLSCPLEDAVITGEN